MAMFFPGGTIYLVYLRCGSVWMTSWRWWKRICHLSFGIWVFCWANWAGQSTNYAEHVGNWCMCWR